MPDKSGKRLSRARSIWYSVIIVCSVFLIYLFAYREMRFFKIPSSSMTPTLYPNDYVLTLNHTAYRRGDVVVLDDPTETGAYIVKRIVGVTGDTVSVRSGVLMINGEYASEPYLLEPMAYVSEPVEIGEGEVFVLGDNRNYSEDSHTWLREGVGGTMDGAVSAKHIIGKVHFIYLPFRRVRFVNSYPLRNAVGA